MGSAQAGQLAYFIWRWNRWEPTCVNRIPLMLGGGRNQAVTAAKVSISWGE